MCDTCGCNVTHANRHLVSDGGRYEHTSAGSESVEVLQNLLHANDHEAAHNREHFDRHGVLAVNLMSSPGAGKTLLLESTVGKLAGKLKFAVIEGDLETENDAKRIRDKGVQAIHDHAQPLVQVCMDGLKGLDVDILTPYEPESLAGIIAFL